MARRRVKKRTHVGAHNGPGNGMARHTAGNAEPKSMVIRIGAGEVGPSISQLVSDVRLMMEPGTASRLKERRSNKLRDYTSMAGPLGVTHLLLFSRSAMGNTNLRLALTPRGPTLHFRVEKYSLCEDIRKAIKHPMGGRNEHLTAPLLVMNNFTTQPSIDGTSPAVPKHLESLVTSVFQSLFPPISPLSTPLSSIRRVLLLNREPQNPSEASPSTEKGVFTINLRHYAIVTKRTDLSRGVRRLLVAGKRVKERKNRRGLPNLGKLEDVADYLLDPTAAGGGFTSGSESEVETDAEVEVLETVSRKVTNRNKTKGIRNGDSKESHSGTSGVEKRAVKLVELGPRMRLRLSKVEEDVCGGKVMWHEYLSKSKEEEQGLDDTWEKRRREKEKRKRAQKENVERKRKTKNPTRDEKRSQHDEMKDEELNSEGSDGEVDMEDEGVDNEPDN